MPPPERRTLFVKLKPREPRRPVLLSAVLRGGGREQVGRVRNISSRGLMIEADEPPGVGTILDVSIGATSVVGRVVWRKGNRFGFHSRGTIAARFFLDVAGEQKGHRPAERPARSGPATTEVYRRISRAIQFVSGVGFALGAAAIIGILLHEILIRPMQALSAHLAP